MTYCNTDPKKLFWFRNFKGNKPFGAMTAILAILRRTAAPLAALDFSLQMQVAVQSVLQFNNINPCTPASPTATTAPMAARTPPQYQDAPRIER